MTNPDTTRPAPGGRGRLLGILAVLAALVAAVVLLPVNDWLRIALDGIESLGIWAPVALCGLYIVSCVLFVPGSLLTLGAGALFGVLTGSVVVSVGATLGAAAAFLVGRYFARDWVAQRVSGSQRFGAVDAAVGREGFKIVLLTRLSPVFPFNVLNYAYGLTGVSFKDYFFASWVGMLPGTVMYVYLGAAAGDLARLGQEGGERSTGEWVLYAVGLVATIVVTVFVTRIARRALNREVALGGSELSRTA